MKLLDWFKIRKEKEIQKKIKKHARNSILASKELLAVAKGRGSIRKIWMLEEKNDEIRREVSADIIRCPLNHEDTANFISLIKTMDSVTNCILNAARDFALVKPKGMMKRQVVNMCEHARGCVKTLSSCVTSFIDGDQREALKLADTVERMEEFMDEKYAKGKALLLREKGSAVELLLIMELISNIEEIADMAEDSSDIIRRMLAKLW